MKCPVCRRGDELRLARDVTVWCRRCHILTQLRPGAKAPTQGTFRGKGADELVQAIAQLGMPRRITP